MYSFKDHKQLLLSLILVIVSSLSYSQLFVGKQMQVHIDTVLTSMEVENELNASISGTSTLVFNASIPQYIATASTNISLPTVEINNPSTVSFLSSFIIRGDLYLKNAKISIHAPLTLSGELIMDDASEILGKELLLQDKHISQYPYSIPLQQLVKAPPSFINSHKILFSQMVACVTCTIQPTSYLEIANSLFLASIPTPPPEVS
jgi:hypothetical protein